MLFRSCVSPQIPVLHFAHHDIRTTIPNIHHQNRPQAPTKHLSLCEFGTKTPKHPFTNSIHLPTTANMSSLTGQESSETQPSNPVNPGATKDDPSVPTKVGSATSTSGLSSGTVDKVRSQFSALCYHANAPPVRSRPKERIRHLRAAERRGCEIQPAD